MHAEASCDLLDILVFPVSFQCFEQCLHHLRLQEERQDFCKFACGISLGFLLLIVVLLFFFAFLDMVQENGEESDNVGNAFIFLLKTNYSCRCTLMTRHGGLQRKFGTDVARLRKVIDLEDPTPLVDQTYLGCTQSAATIDEDTIRTNTKVFQRMTKSNQEGALQKGNKSEYSKRFRHGFMTRKAPRNTVWIDVVKWLRNLCLMSSRWGRCALTTVISRKMILRYLVNWPLSARR